MLKQLLLLALVLFGCATPDTVTTPIDTNNNDRTQPITDEGVLV